MPVIVFGALPATFFCWYAVLVIMAGASEPLPGALLPFSLGFGGFYGTVALWRTGFGCRTRFDRFGLLVGILAMLPMFLVNRTGVLGIAAASPMIVALICLLTKTTSRRTGDLLTTDSRRLFHKRW